MELLLYKYSKCFVLRLAVPTSTIPLPQFRHDLRSNNPFISLLVGSFKTAEYLQFAACLHRLEPVVLRQQEAQ